MTPPAKLLWLILAVIASVVLAAVFIKLGWNHGVVPVTEAAGGHVAGIGFWNAFWLGWVLSILRGDLAKRVAAVEITKAIRSLKT